jgi:hypothetical protein
MSNYPNAYDDDTTLPPVNDNIDQIGGEAINATRDAILAIETALGTNIAGSAPNLAARIGVFINPDGTPNASIIYSLGLVVLPVTNNQIAEAAGIQESKLLLDYRTQDLFNYIRDLAKDVNLAIGWISVSGVKLEPHLIGALYRHDLAQIDVAETSAQFLNNVYRTFRDNTDAYTLINDMNNELLAHQWADGSPFGVEKNITTNNGSVYPNFYAHTASGIFLNTSRFSTIPQIDDNVQLFAEYIDSASIFLLGTRIQNLYSSGVSRVSQSSTLTIDGYGQAIVPVTPVIAFLEGTGNHLYPYDNITQGDDIIQFNPNDGYNNFFDSQWALVRPGDIIRVTYGDGYNIEVPYVIKEKKYNGTVGSKQFAVRIAGKNAFYSPNAIARIDRPLFNPNKYGELAISPVNVGGILSQPASPSLIINQPRGAQALGLGFDADQFDESHYLLYLALFPTGNPADGYTFLPGIDVTGNLGRTPGLYNLGSIVENTNNAFRAAGFNYRFTAFSFEGEFGIAIADSYGNAGFSIVSAVVSPLGVIDELATEIHFPNNVVDLVPLVGNVAPDPLGFGPTGSGVASPPFQTKYGTPTNSAASQFPTVLFIPLRRNNYYVDGSELERLAIEPTQALDPLGDGYWVATVHNVQILSGSVSTTYRIPLDLSASQLKIGKTLVVQSLPAGGAGTLIDFGRFIIQSVTFNCAPNVYTDIIVYDAVHANGFSPAATVQPFAQVAVYFGADSVSFNQESATDLNPVGPFKRNFEVYVNTAGETFTQERARMNLSGTTLTVNSVPLYGSSQLQKFDIVAVSPKLRGYQFGTVNKITLNMLSFTNTTGVFSGYLASYDGIIFTHQGPLTTGKLGEVIRFYDETNIDYIDLILDVNAPSLTSFTNQVIDFQLFPTLQLDTELMLLGTCQVDDFTQTVSQIVDRREFGNTSEKDLSSSVFDIMNLPEKLLHVNGVVRGFDIFNTYSGVEGIINFSGGVVVVNGKILNINNDSISIPIVQESYAMTFYPVNWAVCINDIGEFEAIPLLDFNATLGTPNAPTRIFSALDFVSSTTYNLPAVTFSELVNQRQDLTILYIVSSTVTGTPSSPVITLSPVNDARRFIYKKDWGNIPTLVEDTSLGEFRGFESLTSWFTFDSGYTSSVNVRGVFTNFPSTISFNNQVRFFGDGNAIFNPSNGSLVADTIELDNVEVNADYVAFGASIIRHCIFNLTNTNPINPGAFTAGSHTEVSDTIINVNGPDAISVAFISGLIENVTININSSIGSLLIEGGAVMKNCTINVNSVGYTILVDPDSIMENCIINIVGACTWQISGRFSNNKIYYNTLTAQTPINTPSQFSITGNVFTMNSGSVLPSSFISVPDNVSGTIINNQFYRGPVTMTGGYITGPVSYSAGVVAIANNFFDSTTIDGSNQNLIGNLPLPWLYTSNLNAPPTLPVRQVTASSYTVITSDYVIEVVISTANVVINLPSAVLEPPGRVLVIKDVRGLLDPSTHHITLHRGAITDVIENQTSDLIYYNPFGSLRLICVGNTLGGVATAGAGWAII